jgi:glycine betaine/choline ABC-type transport system substrate-binding protein
MNSAVDQAGQTPQAVAHEFLNNLGKEVGDGV